MILKKKTGLSALLISLFLTLGITGCMSTGGSEETAEVSPEEEAARKKEEDAIKAAMAAIPESSPLSKIELGMTDLRVRKLIGEPDDATRYQTGKQWIPFYFGSDTHREDWLYYGQGRVVFSINRYSANYKVIKVTYEPELN